MDRIFLLGGNFQLTLATNTGIDIALITTENQPAVIIKNWDLLTPTQQTAVLNFLTPLGFQAAN